jgi:hypothetical protein
MKKKQLSTEKKQNLFKFSIELKEVKNEHIQFEPSFIVTMAGDKSSIRSGLIKAMMSDETFAKHITLSAEYFKTIQK